MIRGCSRYVTAIVAAWWPFLFAAAEAPAAGTYISIPDEIESSDGRTLDVERGIFFVPENRSSLDSRIIPVHFIRFAAAEGAQDRPPVFLLPGGPGSDWDFRDVADFDSAERLRRTRDVVYVSQRGNPLAPSLVPELYVESALQPLDEPGSADSDRQHIREQLSQALQHWTAKGIDLAGYDIVNIVDDVHELRAALGYEQIVLRACSFGSQWSLAYIKRWPATVERALLSGVEPLNYAYDSPEWLWASMARLSDAAEADAHLAPLLPPGGLQEAVKTVLHRLESSPVTVGITTPAGADRTVTVGAHDLRQFIDHSFGDDWRAYYENWPRYVLELYGGDYRYLAALTWERRSGTDRDPMIGLLIDNSLGISQRRDRRLLGETEARWLGDINASYRNTRDLTPTPVVDDEFRSNQEIEVPILLVQGDLDWSTPVENAEQLLPSLLYGKLVTVRGAGHCTLTGELPRFLPDVAERLRTFIDVDLDDGTVERYFSTLPNEIELPPFAFRLPVGPSLYEQWLTSRQR